MKLFTLILMMLATTVAIASGEFVSKLSYLDDSPNFRMSPYLGFKVDEDISNVYLSGEVGGGWIDQGAGVNGNYSRISGDVAYLLKNQWKVGVGAGTGSKEALPKQFDNYVHATATYKLW